jgi:hypothetical protein
MLYAAKCYWPGLNEAQLRQATSRLLTNSSQPHITYLGAAVFAADELVLCLFEASSRGAVKHASEQAGLPCERVIETTWISSPNTPALLSRERR